MFPCPQWPHKSHLSTPKDPKRHPKQHLGHPRSSPRPLQGPSMSPQRPPRTPKDLPRSPKDPTESTQGSPEDPRGHPRDLTGTPQTPQGPPRDPPRTSWGCSCSLPGTAHSGTAKEIMLEPAVSSLQPTAGCPQTGPAECAERLNNLARKMALRNARSV